MEDVGDCDDWDLRIIGRVISGINVELKSIAEEF